MICEKCGKEYTEDYRKDKNYIKKISSFELKNKLEEINSLENLVYLCPNHHWELDNDILKI